MSVKLEISGNYLKITDGSAEPVRFPFRDVRFQANETLERISFYMNSSLKPIFLDPFLYEDEPATGKVTIDTVSPTKASGTVILASAVANAFATNTAKCTSVLAGHTLIANGNTYTAVDGTKADNTEFDMSGTDSQCAADLDDSINNDIRNGTSGDLSSTVSTDTVTMTTDVLGAAGNAITLAQTGGTITIGNATFENGVTADSVVANSLIYTAVDGTKADDTEFDISGTDDQAATDLADSIDDDVRTGTQDDLTATATTATVTMVSTVGGTTGNAITLTSSDGTRLAVSGAVLSGGLDDAEVTGILVNSVEIMSGAETSINDTDVLATQVAANITANTSSPNYTAVAVGADIIITSVVEDTAVNGFVVASTVDKATSTDVNMAGAGANIHTSEDVPFATWDDLISFLEDKTGGELI